MALRGPELTVRFERAGACCRVTGRFRQGRPFAVSHMGGASRLPHDLATFVVERELGLAGGFFNLTAHGAVFRSSGRKETRPGRDVIRAHRTALDAAEEQVNAAVGAWKAGAGGPVPDVLTAADRAWAELAEGGGIELVWPRRPLPT
jgi:hypothetical protein